MPRVQLFAGVVAPVAALAMSALLAPPALAGDTPAGTPIAPDVGKRLEQFAKVDVVADLSALGAEDRAALDEIVAASRVIDEIFRLQQGPHVARTAAELEKSELAKDAAEASRQAHARSPETAPRRRAPKRRVRATVPRTVRMMRAGSRTESKCVTRSLPGG